jgi:hypothetical protein
MKKSIFLIVFIFLSLVLEAQQVLPNGQRLRQRVVDRTPGTTTAQKLPEFNVERAVGLTIYEIDRILKKISLKSSDENYKKVVTVYNKFNKDQREVLRINGFTFSQAKTKIESAQSEVLKNRDYSVLEKAYKEVSEGFKPISEQIKEREKKLDEDLKPLLSDKQFKKWKKLQDKIKRKG